MLKKIKFSFIAIIKIIVFVFTMNFFYFFFTNKDSFEFIKTDFFEGPFNCSFQTKVANNVIDFFKTFSFVEIYNFFSFKTNIVLIKYGWIISLKKITMILLGKECPNLLVFVFVKSLHIVIIHSYIIILCIFITFLQIFKLSEIKQLIKKFFINLLKLFTYFIILVVCVFYIITIVDITLFFVFNFISYLLTFFI